MTEFSFSKQAALKAVDQREDLGISHFCSKEKRPPVEDPMGVVYVHFQSSGNPSEIKICDAIPFACNKLQRHRFWAIVHS